MIDDNETAFDAILQGTDDQTGPEVLAEIIGALREGIDEGATDEDLALRLWPRLARVVAMVNAAELEELHAGLQRWMEARANAAAELGRKGGKKGGKARAKKLSPDERSEIARTAARARWKKGRSKGDG